MPTWNQSFPKSKPFKCCAAWHLRKSGNLLAIYDFLGGLTNGGKNPFYSSIRKVAIFFYGKESDATYNVTVRNFRTLRQIGLIKKKEGNQWEYIRHDDWAEAHLGKCQVREQFPWQETADPFVGAIWKIAKGKIRVSEGVIKTIRKVATDEEFLHLFEYEINLAEARRVPGGDWSGTSPKACFWKAYRLLRERKEATVLESAQHR